MLLDILLLLVIAGIVALSAAEGLARSAVMLVIFYLMCIILGLTVSAFNLGQVLSNAVPGSAAGQAFRNPGLSQGIVFLGLLVPILIFAALLSHATLEDAQIRALGWGDNALATVVGSVFALAFAAVLCNVWGLIVSVPWAPVATWQTMRSTYDQSVLRPVMLQLLLVYRHALFVFSTSGYPPFFVPQP